MHKKYWYFIIHSETEKEPGKKLIMVGFISLHGIT